MCEACWLEAGSPDVLSENHERFVELAFQVYEAHGAGGSLHIALDDFNLEDESLAFCSGLPGLTPVESACLDELRAMTLKERQAAVHDAYGRGL